MSALPILPGGLMRCCIATIHEHDDPSPDGTVIPCKWCNSTILVEGGKWRWNRDA